ncbi:hypothetical protein MMC21_001720 [Puttea exsequens]|nr:hypothetical protein [Puttea exsequens]
MANRKYRRYRIFIHEIVERALGVFLWVYLVVYKILVALGANGKLEDPKRRPEKLPKTLEKYFRQISERGINKADYTPSARVFLMMAYAVQPLSVTAYRYLEEQQNEWDLTLKAPLEPMAGLDCISLRKGVTERISYLCKDLLEVNQITRDGTLIDFQVDFLYRSVKGFRNDKDMREMLVDRATNHHTGE